LNRGPLTSTSTRDERKQQTRRSLLNAALDLSLKGKGFAGVSLREVTRAAGVVPTAFYRHFRDLDELGLALVDDVCLQLRRLMREARATARALPDVAIRDSVRGYLGYVRAHAPAFEFLLRERSGGSPVLREAIAKEIRYFVHELATDLRLLEPFAKFSASDLEMVADLVVTTVMTLSLEILSLPPGHSRLEEDAVARGVKQLRLIFLGTRAWRSD
jgi:AcrR family transcriptional regulator